ncbi:GPW/gp25 family protein [Rhodovulum sp. DZ06]|uniref:GPW/gp25 family protein n=1 Tax=Rhodovulum sp. DZ06 TaxID=3425126 RepID=UPI003D3504F0
MTRLAHPFAPGADGRSAAHPYGSPAHVAQMLRLLILTQPGERAMRPGFGSPARQMLFAAGDGIAAEALAAALESGVAQWLGHVLEVEALEVRADGAGALTAELAYRLRDTGRVERVAVEVTGG